MVDQANTAHTVEHRARWYPKVLCHAEEAPMQPVLEQPQPAQHVPARPVDGAALQSTLTAGLDKVSHGIAVLDVEGHAHYANVAARTLFGRLGWPKARAGQITSTYDCTAALKQVCLRGRRELLRATVNGVPLVVVLVPLSMSGKTLAFAVFGREELCGSVELQMFALQYQLTHAETMVLRQLTRGLNASAIAREHGVACNTVLTQIAAIRSKTNCSSVRSLLDTLARLPPMSALQPISDAQ